MLFIKDDKPQHVDEIDLASGYWGMIGFRGS